MPFFPFFHSVRPSIHSHSLHCTHAAFRIRSIFGCFFLQSKNWKQKKLGLCRELANEIGKPQFQWMAHSKWIGVFGRMKCFRVTKLHYNCMAQVLCEISRGSRRQWHAIRMRHSFYASRHRLHRTLSKFSDDKINRIFFRANRYSFATVGWCEAFHLKFVPHRFLWKFQQIAANLRINTNQLTLMIWSIVAILSRLVVFSLDSSIETSIFAYHYNFINVFNSSTLRFLGKFYYTFPFPLLDTVEKSRSTSVLH